MRRDPSDASQPDVAQACWLLREAWSAWSISGDSIALAFDASWCHSVLDVHACHCQAVVILRRVMYPALWLQGSWLWPTPTLAEMATLYRSNRQLPVRGVSLACVRAVRSLKPLCTCSVACSVAQAIHTVQGPLSSTSCHDAARWLEALKWISKDSAGTQESRIEGIADDASTSE